MKRKQIDKQRIIKVLIAAWIVLLLLVPPVFSQGNIHFGKVKIEPGIAYRAEYNDNIYSANTAEEKDFIHTITPTIGLVYEGSRPENSIRAGYSVDLVAYTDFDDNNYQTHRPYLSVNYKSPMGIYFGANESFIQTSDPYGDKNTYDVGEPQTERYTNTFDTPFVGYTLTGYMALGATQPAVGSVAVIGVTPTSGNGCSARIKGDGTVEYHYGGLANAWDAPEPATVPVEEWIKVDIYGGPEGMIIFVNGQAFRNIYSGTGWDGGFDISSIWLGGGWGCAPAGYDTFSITPGLPDEAPIDCETAIVRGYGWDTDLNQDCSVDLLDYALLAQKWLMCIEPTDQNCQKPWE